MARNTSAELRCEFFMPFITIKIVFMFVNCYGLLLILQLSNTPPAIMLQPPLLQLASYLCNQCEATLNAQCQLNVTTLDEGTIITLLCLVYFLTSCLPTGAAPESSDYIMYTFIAVVFLAMEKVLRFKASGIETSELPFLKVTCCCLLKMVWMHTGLPWQFLYTALILLAALSIANVAIAWISFIFCLFHCDY